LEVNFSETVDGIVDEMLLVAIHQFERLISGRT
jgi:hypothetical protein